jgi:hypothetical protein
MARWNEYIGGEADEFGNGPGSYDIDQSVWHVNVSRRSLSPLLHVLMISSAVLPPMRFKMAGVSLTLFWAGQTRLHMALSFLTTCTGFVL